jgi:hypothetical protein
MAFTERQKKFKEKVAAQKVGIAPATAKARPSKLKEKLEAKKTAINNAATPKPTTTGTIKDKLAAKKAATAPPKPAPAPAKPTPAPAAATPAMQKKKMVSKKTAYDIKEASNPKLKASARKNYAMNAEASMKNKKKK